MLNELYTLMCERGIIHLNNHAYLHDNIFIGMYLKKNPKTVKQNFMTPL